MRNTLHEGVSQLDSTGPHAHLPESEVTPLREQLQATLSGSYTIERELGGGGMSKVFVADETRLRRKVVVKVLSPELAQGISVERFEREIQIVAALQHANIVPVHTAGDTNGLPFYTMPFVEGESLRARLGHGPLPVAEVIGILRDVSKALAYAHQRGVVHRDIKPDNVLISGGVAVVTDFGIAKAISAARTSSGAATLTQIGTSIGTPAYMAPEQAAGDPEIDHRADIYALGAMAYEMLSGQAVFANRSPQRMLAAHMSEAPKPITEFRGDLPASLASLVMSCLAKDPSDRPQQAADIARTLDTITSGSSMPTMPAVLLGGPGMLKKALAIYAVAFVAVAILAKAAIVGIGLPDWVFPGSLIVMALGLPVVLWTGYVQRVTRRAMTMTPTFTPGGSPSMAQGAMATMALKAAPHVSWYRTARGGMYALGSFIALVAVFMAMRAFGIGPAGTLFSAGSLKADDKLLVSGFTFSPASDSALGPILAEGVLNALGQSRAVRLLSPSDVATVMAQMKRTGNLAANDSLSREVAERSGASAIVGGNIVHAPNGYTVNLTLRRTTDGAVLASFPETAASTKDLIDVVDALTRKLRGKMGESLRQVNRSVPLAQATTSSLEALRRYSEGARANDVDGDFDRAVRVLREAVAIDSTFALAWRKLALALGNGGYSAAARDSAYERGARYAERLPDRERGLVLGAYFALRNRDIAKAVAAYESAYAADSNSNAAANQLMNLYARRRDYARALRYGRRLLAIGGLPQNAGLLAALLVQMGDSRAAQALIDSVTQGGTRTEEHVFVQQARVASAYARGRVDSVLPLGEAMRRSSNSRTRLEGAATLMREAELRGQPTRAARLYTDISTMRRGLGDAVPELDSLALASLDIVVRGRMQDGMRRLDAVAGKGPSLEAANLYALAGDVGKAKAVLARYESATPGGVQGVASQSWHEVRGSIALAERRFADAIREFRASDTDTSGVPASCVECAQINLARAFDAANQGDSAVATMERYLAIPPARGSYNFYDAYFLRATVHERLGQLYEARGDTAYAVNNYRAFIDLWKRAEPELQPRVADAKRRLEKLTPVEKPR